MYLKREEGDPAVDVMVRMLLFRCFSVLYSLSHLSLFSLSHLSLFLLSLPLSDLSVSRERESLSLSGVSLSL